MTPADVLAFYAAWVRACAAWGWLPPHLMGDD